MKRRHTRNYYLNWLMKNNKTISDLVNAIHRNYGLALEQNNVIDYLIHNQVTAHQLRSMFEML